MEPNGIRFPFQERINHINQADGPKGQKRRSRECRTRNARVFRDLQESRLMPEGEKPDGMHRSRGYGGRPCPTSRLLGPSFPPCTVRAGRGALQLADDITNLRALGLPQVINSRSRQAGAFSRSTSGPDVPEPHEGHRCVHGPFHHTLGGSRRSPVDGPIPGSPGPPPSTSPAERVGTEAGRSWAQA